MPEQQSRPGVGSQAAAEAFGGADPSVAGQAGHARRHTGHVTVDLYRLHTDHAVSRRLMEVAACCPVGVRITLKVPAGMPVPLALEQLRPCLVEVESDDPATVGRWVRSLREGVARWVAP